jgi:recombination protein RecT
MANAVEPTTQKTEIVVFREQLTNMGPQFQAALPAHIPLERFERVVLTACQNNPDLIMKCTRKSLFNACVRAAQDGLLPDGREGAIVPYGSDAQWLPMIAGLRKKVRNSGEIIDWDVHLVYENDSFDHELGDQAFIRHKRAMGPRGDIVGGYSICHLKDGGVSREIMSIAEIEAVRKQSSRAKSDKSPWNIAAFYGEMARKTIARRHAKNLPMSSDLDDLIRRDDELYDMNGAADEARPRRRTLGAALDQLAGGDTNGNGHGADEPERDKTAQQEQEGREAAQQGGKPPTETENPEPPKDDAKKPTADKPAAAKEAKPAVAKEPEKPKEPEPPKLPTNEREYKVYSTAWIDSAVAAKDATMLNTRWNSPEEKKVRNGANVSSEIREEVYEHLTAARGKVEDY